MSPKTLVRLLLPIGLLIDGIRMARGVTGGSNTDDIDRMLLDINSACDKLMANLMDRS